MKTISNEFLKASISELGAECVALTDLRTNREVIWNGDERWWNGHSPLLFPITGGLWNGEAHIGEQVFSIPKHGFARRRTWRLVSEDEAKTVNNTAGNGTADSISFELVPQEGDEAVYPYRYKARVDYRLREHRLEVRLTVENLDESPIYFQFGGHPAFHLPDFDASHDVDGFIRWEGKPTHLLRAGKQGCIVAEAGRAVRFPLPTFKEDLLPIAADTFAHEALILEEQISAATLLDRSGRPLLRVESEAPVWLFWSPAGKRTPFVCFEPWFGLPDLEASSLPFTSRAYMQSAAAGTSWTGGYTIEIF